MRSGDLEAVLDTARQSLQNPWNFEQFSAELKIPGGLRFVAEQQDFCGYVIFRQVGPEAELLQLAVLSCSRRQGIASALLMYGIRQLFSLHVEECFLEVRNNNRSGRIFYEQAGFHQVGLRKKYYSRPVDDAVIMKKIVNKDSE